MNEAGLAKLKRSVGRLKSLIDAPEFDSWVWNEQLLKSLDDVAWWHRPLDEDTHREEEKKEAIKGLNDYFKDWYNLIRLLDGE